MIVILQLLLLLAACYSGWCNVGAEIASKLMDGVGYTGIESDSFDEEPKDEDEAECCSLARAVARTAARAMARAVADSC